MAQEHCRALDHKENGFRMLIHRLGDSRRLARAKQAAACRCPPPVRAGHGFLGAFSAPAGTLRPRRRPSIAIAVWLGSGVATRAVVSAEAELGQPVPSQLARTE
jgi:hypothetical protein